jgi:tryptophanyl-tRNA synthetase
MKKVLVSGIQSSGKLHIGNYFGAIKQNIELGNSGDYESYVFIADYHSMTSLTDAKERAVNTFDAACTYLACGLDPSKVALFVQSSVKAHTELAWILNTVTPMPMLHLAHAFKDSEAKNKDVNVGLFTYPVLMAADILMYNADTVPVGKDQEQHIEIAREIAGKFNRAYEEVFTMPQAHVVKDVATVPGIDGTKMSKSKNNHIPLFGTNEEIKKKVMSIVTDSARPEDTKNPDENAIYQIHKLFLSKNEDAILRAKFENGGYGYKDAKEACAEAIISFVSPLREKYNYYQSNPQEVETILEEGARKAQTKSEELMNKVHQVTGLR